MTYFRETTTRANKDRSADICQQTIKSGDELLAQGKNDEATKQYNFALKRAKECDFVGKETVAHQVGLMCMQRLWFVPAADFFQTELDLLKQVDRKQDDQTREAIAEAHYQLGKSYNRRHLTEQAENHFVSALSYAQQVFAKQDPRKLEPYLESLCRLLDEISNCYHESHPDKPEAITRHKLYHDTLMQIRSQDTAAEFVP